MTEAEFFEYLVRRGALCHSQLGQDLWVLSTLGHKSDGYFVDIGAYDGVNISNTLLLERAGWRGLLVEPNPRVFAALQDARSAPAVRACVWTADGAHATLHDVRNQPELSRITSVPRSDLHDESGARDDFNAVEVETIRPETLLRTHGAPPVIDYLSVDVEGGELEILSAYPFDAFPVRLISVEHNYGEQRAAIHALLTGHGFTRVFTAFSQFDDWYVNEKLVPQSPGDAGAEAASYARVAATSAPPVGRGTGPLIRRIAEELRGAKRFGEAIALLGAYSNQQPADVPALCDLATTERDAGNSERAEALYREAIAAAPQDPVAHTRLAAMKLHDHKPAEALELAQAALAHAPDEKAALGTAARALVRLGDHRHAAAMALRGIAQEALPASFLIKIAARLGQTGGEADAAELLRSAHGAAPDDPALNTALLDALIAWRGQGGTLGPPMPAGNAFEERIAIAEEGRSCVAEIPKVAGAGEVVDTPTGRVQRMYDGTLVPLDAYYGAWITRIIQSLDGHHEPQEERVFHAVLEHLGGGFMLELGALWGFYSAVFLRRFGADAEAMMVEPDVRNVAVGLETLRINALTARVELGAVPPIPPELRDQPLNFGNSFTPGRFSVRAHLAASGRREIAILHADIQGAELRLMTDIADALSRRVIRYLFVSTHGEDRQLAVLKAVRDAGYFLIAEHDGRESFSYDGLVVARAPDQPGPGFIDVPRRIAPRPAAAP